MNLMRIIKRKANSLARRCVKEFALGLCFPLVYAWAARKPIDQGKVLFLDSKEAKLPDSFKVLYEYLETAYTFDLDFVSLGQHRVHMLRYYLNCIEFAKKAATASYIVLNDASDVVSCFPLRSQTKVAQLWHGCGAFKKWGMSTADLLFGGTRKDILRHPFYRNLSLVTVSSPEVIWAYAEAMVLEDRQEIIKPLGVSRTDIFFDDEFLKDARSHVESLIPETIGKKIVLYAPTFRGRVAAAEGPDQLDIAGFKQVLGDRYVLLIKHHPFVKKLPCMPEGCEDFAFDVSGDLPIDELLCVADVCISDYSSLVFEYSLFLRPVLFFAYDLEEYGDWRGFYYDYDELTPGPVLRDNQAMIDYILSLDDGFDCSQIEAFRDKFMSACGGHSTKRICEDFFGAELDNYKKSSAHDVLSRENSDAIDISIIIPAYNAMPEFEHMLESVARQTYDRKRMELIVVDDCSSDGTWEKLNDFGEKYPDLLVAERLDKPSGSPAKPRNVGLSKARGKYIFFLDADDWLGDRAVEKMLNHAIEWDSDVLLVKMKGENGREVPKSMFVGNQPKVDIFHSKVMWSFAPLKLFRRSLIQDLRFPDFMPEDISFVLRAYCFAKVVSVASDYDYYHVSWHDGDKHASLSSWDDAESNFCAYTDILDFMESEIADEDRYEVLLRRLFRRDVLFMVEKIADLPHAEQEVRLAAIKDLFGSYYVEEVYRTCPAHQRVVLDAAFFGSIDDALQAVKLDTSETETFSSCEKDGSIVFLLPGCDESVSVDVTNAIKISCKLTRSSLDKNALLGFEGCAEVDGIPPSLMEDVSVRIVYRDEQGALIGSELCEIRHLDFGQHHTDSRFDWRCESNVARVINDTRVPLGKMHLYFELEQNAFHKKIRLGKKTSTPAAVGAFLAGESEFGKYEVKPYLTPYDNFSLRVKR